MLAFQTLLSFKTYKQEVVEAFLQFSHKFIMTSQFKQKLNTSTKTTHQVSLNLFSTIHNVLPKLVLFIKIDVSLVNYLNKFRYMKNFF